MVSVDVRHPVYLLLCLVGVIKRCAKPYSREVFNGLYITVLVLQGELHELAWSTSVLSEGEHSTAL